MHKDLFGNKVWDLPEAKLKKRRSKCDELVAAMYRCYQRGMSVSQIADLYKWRWGKYSRQRIIEYFRNRGYEMRKRGERQFVTYKGERYTLDSARRYRRTSRDTTKPLFLHRKVWQDYHGHIPPNHYVAPLDGDYANTNIDNLYLVSIRTFRKTAKSAKSEVVIELI